MKTFHGFISSENTSEKDSQAIKNILSECFMICIHLQLENVDTVISRENRVNSLKHEKESRQESSHPRSSPTLPCGTTRLWLMRSIFSIIDLFSLYVSFSQKRSQGNLTHCLFINYG